MGVENGLAVNVSFGETELDGNLVTPAESDVVRYAIPSRGFQPFELIQTFDAELFGALHCVLESPQRFRQICCPVFLLGHFTLASPRRKKPSSDVRFLCQ